MLAADRAQRVLIGFILLCLNFLSNDFSELSSTALISMVVQIELLLTGLIGWCPLYWSLSFKNKTKKEKL